MIERKKKIDLILYSGKLKLMLKKRLFFDLNLKYADIIAHAKELNYKGINKPNLSRYFNSTVPMAGSISQQTIVYLCLRYGIDIKIKIKEIPYDEQVCIQNVKNTL